MTKNTRHRPLETRLFKFKKPVMKFFCPLCSTARAFTISPRLSPKNHIQIALITLSLIGMTYSFMGWRAIFWFFFVWSAFEFAVKVLFKKEIPCPHCGFDASWYKRDVVKAREKVNEFWEKNQTELPSQKGVVAPEAVVASQLQADKLAAEKLNQDLSA